LTSLIWAAIHLQYDWYGQTMIFLGGILLGCARWRTGSVLLPMLLHGLMNLVASAELTAYMLLGGG
jgi:membrane protease YdiL (CAAX protease family)